MDPAPKSNVIVEDSVSSLCKHHLPGTFYNILTGLIQELCFSLFLAFNYYELFRCQSTQEAIIICNISAREMTVVLVEISPLMI